MVKIDTCFGHRGTYKYELHYLPVPSGHSHMCNALILLSKTLMWHLIDKSHKFKGQVGRTRRMKPSFYLELTSCSEMVHYLRGIKSSYADTFQIKWGFGSFYFLNLKDLFLLCTWVGICSHSTGKVGFVPIVNWRKDLYSQRRDVS